MRYSQAFALYILICLAAIAALGISARSGVSRFVSGEADLNEVVAALRLTDLSVFGDARYARHPSQADLFSPFQDSPGSIDHFPSGSVIAPPDFDGAGSPLKATAR